MALSTLQPATIAVASSGLTTSITAYTAGDMLGAEATATGMAATSGGRGVVTAITVQNSNTASTTGALDVRLFSAASSPAADNAANSWSDANSRLQVVAYVVPAPTTSALNSTTYVGNLWLPYLCTSSANLFLNVICLGAPAVFATATDLQYTFEVLQWI
jgi:hypothetical protein